MAVFLTVGYLRSLGVSGVLGFHGAQFGKFSKLGSRFNC